MAGKYEERALAAEAWAKRASTPQERADCLTLAALWRQLADEIDDQPPLEPAAETRAS